LIIAVDAAGGDYAPQEIVKGAIKAARDYKVDIALVGKRPILHVLTGHALKHGNISIVNASQVIGCGESPVKAVKGKPDSSIVVGMEMLRRGEADAFVSAGNTGAVVCAALFQLGKRPGIARPSLGGILRLNPPHAVLLVDIGANVDCRPAHLVEFARLGAEYFGQLRDIPFPRVALLNNGEEDSKGNRLIRETYELLGSSGLNFAGNIEGQDIIRGQADVVVTDGFTGNLVLKTIEGLSESFMSSLKNMGYVFSRVYSQESRSLLRDLGFFASLKKIDYREYGGACLLGVRGNVIIAHGRSQAKAIRSAIRLAKHTAQKTTINKNRVENKVQV